MSQQIINIGSAPNDGTGDQLRVSFDKCNLNFTELYAGVVAAGPIGNAIEYQFNNSTTEPPAAGEIRFNQATQASTTLLWASQTTSAGINIKQFLSAATSGSTIIVQDKNDNTNYVKFNVTGTPVDKTTYWEFPVAVTASGGTLPNARILAAVTAAASTGGAPGGTRPLLTANITYYVRVDGSDSNTGLVDSAGGAFLTIQKAINVLNTLDGGGFAATIQVRTGTFTGAVRFGTPFIGFSSVQLQGDATTPANVLLSVANANAITVDNGTVVFIRGFKITTTGSAGYAIETFNQSIANINGNMEYGACIQGHLFAFTNSTINVSVGYTISGGSPGGFHLAAPNAVVNNSLIAFTVTLTGTPAFAVFAYADRLGLVNWGNVTFSGAATGVRYQAGGNGVIFTNGGGANYFPGNAPGIIPAGSGGQYG
jgi:hypothetical protein